MNSPRMRPLRATFLLRARERELTAQSTETSFFFGQSIDISGHIKGDAIIFAQSVRINGQIDGNIRSFFK